MMASTPSHVACLTIKCFCIMATGNLSAPRLAEVNILRVRSSAPGARRPPIFPGLCRKWAQRRPFLRIASGAEAPLLPACPGCTCWSHWLPCPAACRAARAAATGAPRPARPSAATCPTMGAAHSTAVANAGSWTACARCPSCEGPCPFACWQEQPCL